MASPFSIFRNNLKPLVAALTLLSLIAFVALPAVEMYQQGNMAGSGNTVVATYNGGSVGIDDVTFYNRVLAQTNRFLAEVAQQVFTRGGTPSVPNFGPDGRGGLMYGISAPSGNPRATVMTQLYAKKAAELGFELDDTAIDIWMDRFTDGKLSDNELAAIRARVSQNSLGRSQMFNLLRTELLANIYLRMLATGVATSQTFIVTPAEAWQNFLKLNQQATVVAYPVLVEEYLEKTDAPSQATIETLYAEGKERFNDPNSPDPGFRRRYQADIEFVAAHYEDFLQRRIAQLSEEELRAEYDRRAAGGEFSMPQLTEETPAEETPAEETPTEETPTEETPAEETPAEETPAEEAPAEETPAEEAPAEETPAEEAPAEEAPAEETPAEEAPAEETPAEETPAEDSSAQPEVTEEAGDEAASAANPLRVRGSATRLVTLQAEETEAAQADTQDDAPDAEGSQDTAEQPEGDAPSPDDTSGDDATSDDATSEETPAEAADESAAPAEATTTPRPFEEVRDEIARSLAAPAAQEAMDSAIAQAHEAMRSYSIDFAVYQDSVASIGRGEEPELPNLRVMAERLGLRHGQTGMHDMVSIRDTPIGQSRVADTQAYALEMFSDTRPVYSPVRSRRFAGVEDQIAYSSWKSAAKDGFIPTLDEVREEVVAAARLMAARELARTAANEIAAKANAAPNADLGTIVPESRKNLILENVGPFNWMMSIAGMGMRPFLASVPELNNVGNDFMRTVFTSPAGEFHVAPNEPKTVYYVVKATEIKPPAEELYARFMQANQRRDAVMMAQENITSIQIGENESFEESMGVEWNEEAYR